MRSIVLAGNVTPGRTGPDPRLFVEAVVWIARTGCAWRDLPDAFGKWSTVFKRFRRWVMADAFNRMFRALAEDAEFEYAMIDGSIVKVHRHGQGAKEGTQSQAIGRSRGGMTTKIMAWADAFGNLTDFRLLPGQAHNLRGTEALILHREPKANVERYDGLRAQIAGGRHAS